jgi:hypothetical protein
MVTDKILKSFKTLIFTKGNFGILFYFQEDFIRKNKFGMFYVELFS